MSHHLVITDAKGLTTWVSAAFTDNTGFTLDDMRGRTPGAVLQRADASPAAVAAMAAAIRERRPCHGIELLNYRKDGSAFTVRLDIEPQFDAEGRLTGFMSVQSDITEDQARLARLQMLQRWYEATAIDATIGFFEYDLDTRSLRWDDRLRGLLGLPPGPVPARIEDVEPFVASDDRAALRRAWAASMAAGSGHADVKVPVPGQGPRHLHAEWAIVTLPAGVRLATGTVRDVTRSLAARHESALQREQLLMAADAGHIGLTRERLGSGRIGANAAARRLFDLPEQGDVDTALVLSRVHEQDLPMVVAAREAAAARGVAIDLQYRVVHRNGAVRHVMVRRHVLRTGDGAGDLIAAVIDLTDMVQAQAREQDLVQAQRAALELAGIGVWELHEFGQDLDFDDRMRQIHGWAGLSRQVPVWRWREALHEDDRDRIVRLWSSLERGEATQAQADFRIGLPDGGTRWLRCQFARVVRPDGTLGGLRGTGRDITDEVQAGRARQRADAVAAERDQAAALASARSSLLAAVSHEVRTPLSAILVATEQLARSPLASEPPLQSWLSMLADAGRHLHTLAEDLLRGSATEHGEARDPARPTGIEAMVRRSCRWLEGAAREADVALIVDESLQQQAVMAPPVRLRQVLLNLISNGIKYNRPGGWVRCSAEPAAPGRVCLVVRDNGLGMTPEQVGSLFRPFDRLGREFTGTTGFGLGLVLVQRLLKEMGADLQVHSTVGQGTEVRLDLPCGDGDAATDTGWDTLSRLASSTSCPPPPPRLRQKGPGGQALRVLAIDDDKLTGILLGAQFEALGGVQLSVAGDIDQALSQLAEGRHPPDLVMLDMHLATGRGDTALRRLREAGYGGKAVAYTGDADDAARAAMLAAGFDDIWIKPMSTEVLGRAVERTLAPAGPGHDPQRRAAVAG